MTARCPCCQGTKALFEERPMEMYQGRLTRIYLGKCTFCDADGNITLEVDHKQLSAGEVA